MYVLLLQMCGDSIRYVCWLHFRNTCGWFICIQVATNFKFEFIQYHGV
jgi:hypothetical protein